MWIFCIIYCTPIFLNKPGNKPNVMHKNILLRISHQNSSFVDEYLLEKVENTWILFVCLPETVIRLQNLPWYKTGLVSRQVLHLLSKLQNWICSKTGQYKTCLASNTKIEASIRTTKPKPWQPHLPHWDSRNFYSKWKGSFSADAKPVLVRQVERRHKAGFGAAGLGTAQSWFWSRQKAGFGAVGLGSAQSRFWSRHRAGFGAVGLGSAESQFWSRHKAGLGAVGLGSAQSRFWSRHKAGFGAAGYKTGFVSRQVLHRLSMQNLSWY